MGPYRYLEHARQCGQLNGKRQAYRRRRGGKKWTEMFRNASVTKQVRLVQVLQERGEKADIPASPIDGWMDGILCGWAGVGALPC